MKSSGVTSTHEKHVRAEGRGRLEIERKCDQPNMKALLSDVTGKKNYEPLCENREDTYC